MTGSTPRRYFSTTTLRKDSLRKVLFCLAVLAPLLILVISGWMGIDFGYHWDEELQFELVDASLESGVFLPGWYKYPSFSYWLSLIGTTPHLIAAVSQVGGDWQELVAHLQGVIWTPAFKLQVRLIFLLISSLSVLWTGLQPIAAGRGWLEGLAAAALLGLSWEVGYHVRWIAPDAVMMQFGALTYLMITMAIRRPKRPNWLVGAAIAAGLACATKYPGGLLVLPVLIAAYLLQPNMNPLRRLTRAGLLVVPVFIASYLVITPGTLLEPINFFKSIGYELRHYGAGMYDQPISPGLVHLGRMLNYLFQVFFSHFRPVAWIFALLVIIGGYSLYRRSRRDFLLLISFPLVYLLYFSAQSVMVVRNLLVIAPFLACLGAQGIGFVWEKLPDRRLRLGWCALLVCLMALNAGWLFYAANSIQTRSQGKFTAQFVAHVSENPGQTFAASPSVWRQVSTLKADPPENLLLLPEDTGQMVAFYASEGIENPRDWPTNRVGLATRVFGPWEVNFDFYPLWAGDDRIVLMPYDRALKIGIRVVR